MAVLLKDLRNLSYERREALALGLVTRVTGAACGGRGTWWSQIERVHAATSVASDARAVAKPAMELCASCPVMTACDQLARVNHYTGLAAGMAWKSGNSRNVGQVPEQKRVTPAAA